MGYKRSRAASRAWSILRLALLWARKGGVLKCRLMSELKALHRHSSARSRRRRLDAVHYGERELSFDETPIIRLGMSRPASLRFKLPNIPCIKPSVVDFDYDFDDDDDNNDIYGRDAQVDDAETECDDCEYYPQLVEEEEEGGIDKKADEFIARFYQQMKMQRQVSYIEYQEMLTRGST